MRDGVQRDMDAVQELVHVCCHKAMLLEMMDNVKIRGQPSHTNHVLKSSNSELQNEQLEMSNKLRSATGGKDSDMNAYVDLMDSLQTSK